MGRARVSIKEGDKISTPLFSSKVFPVMVTQMIAVGEETGRLDQMLLKVANFYEEEVDATLKGLTSLIEPLMIVGLGLIVGFIAVSVISPIYSLGWVPGRGRRQEGRRLAVGDQTEVSEAPEGLLALRLEPEPCQEPSASLPGRRQIDELVREYHRTKELALRDRLISQHLYLVQTVARKFSGLGESHDDLLQEGAMGLINAVDLYDPERGVQFSTYATHLVEGQIRHYLRDKGKLIKQPAWVQELTTKIMKATEALTQELDREPTQAEIAARVGTTQQKIKEMLEAQGAE